MKKKLVKRFQKLAVIKTSQDVADADPNVERYGRFSFIYSVWLNMPSNKPSLSEFKKMLMMANNQGKIKLVRADMVGDMDPEMVERSETQAILNGRPVAEWHFIMPSQNSPYYNKLGK